MLGITLSSSSEAYPFWRLVDQGSAFESTPSIRMLGYLPHLTFARFEQIAPDFLRDAIMPLNGEHAVSLTFDRLGFFDGDPTVMWLAPRACPRLVDLHARIHQSIDTALCDPHYRPISWIPHLTIAVDIPASRRAAALEFASRPIDPFSIKFDAIDIVSWPPVRVEHRLGLLDEPLFVLHPDTEAAHAAAAQLFEKLEPEFRSQLSPTAEVLHVGATSIAGCITKGDLDILARVDERDFVNAELYVSSRLSRTNSKARGHDFASFESAENSLKLGVQLTIKGGELDVFDIFAQALRVDSRLVTRYNALKQAYNNKPMSEYRAAKAAFIRGVLHCDPVAP